MSDLEKHPQWPAVSQIHSRLTQNGFKALIAGGAVRDLLLGRVANDIDIATDASPEQVEALFEKTVMVGRQFGVARVIVDGHDVEVATFRKDGPYLDGRRPEHVEYSSEKEDALRRDFTINAMFYDPIRKELIDHVGGQADLMKGIIRTVGDPERRFEEDKLRVLRAVRFMAQLNFTIDPKTLTAMAKYSAQINQVSQERIRDEWQKVLLSEFTVKGIEMTKSSSLWTFIFKGWTYKLEEYKKHFALNQLDAEKAWVVWFLLHFHSSKEELAKEALSWKFPKELIKKMIYCQQSLSQLSRLSEIDPVDIAIFLDQPNSRFAVEIYKQLFQGFIKEEWFERLSQANQFFQKGSLPEPLISGDDLIQFGIRPGPQIAKKLKDLYRIQIKEGVSNKEELLKQLPAT